MHGSTVATNTALERTGARMAVLVTAGHRDVLTLGLMYSIKAREPERIVRRDLCLEVDEGLATDGRVRSGPGSARERDRYRARRAAAGMGDRRSRRRPRNSAHRCARPFYLRAALSDPIEVRLLRRRGSGTRTRRGVAAPVPRQASKYGG